MYVVVPSLPTGLSPGYAQTLCKITLFYIVDVVCIYEKVDAGLHVW
jgi:hypothetical protein